MSSMIRKWKVPCVTEGRSHIIWSVTCPEKCPASDAHQIDTSNIEILDKIAEDEYQITQIKVFENFDATQNQYRCETFRFTMPPGPSRQALSFPYNISVLSLRINISNTHIGDTVDVYANPGQPVGMLMAPAISGTRRLSVSPTVTANACRGYMLYLGDNCVGEIKNVYSDSLELVNPLATYHTPGALCFLRAHIIKNLYCDGAREVNLGSSKIGASQIIAGWMIEVEYENVSDTTKELVFSLEYLY